MISKHPIRFLISVVGSFFVHVAAVFAMLAAVPEVSPTELFRPVSVSLVPESSIPGTGLQLEEQTEDMGSEIPLSTATSTVPAVKTTDFTATRSKNEDIENEFQTPSELENAFDAESMEVADSEHEAIPEPKSIEEQSASLPEPLELAAELSESAWNQSLDATFELENIEKWTEDAEPMARVQDTPESTQTLSIKRIEIDSDSESNQPETYVDRTEVEFDSTHAQDAAGSDSNSRHVDEESLEIRTASVVRPIQAATDRIAADRENEWIPREYPNAMLDSEDSESELIARASPDTIQNTIDEYPPPEPAAETLDSQEFRSVATQAAQVNSTTLEPIDSTLSHEPATLLAAADIEHEAFAWSFPNAIQDVIDEHAPALRFLEMADSRKKQTQFDEGQPADTVWAADQSASKIQLNNSLLAQSATDVEQELIARVFPDSIRDLVGNYPTPKEFNSTAGIRDVLQSEEHTQGTNPATAGVTKKTTAIDAADEVEARYAYFEVDLSSLLADSPEAVEVPNRMEPKSASIAQTTPLQSIDENPNDADEQAPSPQNPSENHLWQELEPVDSQPKLAKKHVERKDSVDSEWSEQPTLERAQNTDGFPIENDSVTSETIQVAAIKSESETAGLIESADIAPQFGVSGLSNPAPKYPYIARANNEEGRVILRVYVDSRGNAEKVETHISSGSRRLDNAAKKAVRKWTFLPARTAGVASDGIALVPVTFVLTN